MRETARGIGLDAGLGEQPAFAERVGERLRARVLAVAVDPGGTLEGARRSDDARARELEREQRVVRGEPRVQALVPAARFEVLHRARRHRAREAECRGDLVLAESLQVRAGDDGAE